LPSSTSVAHDDATREIESFDLSRLQEAVFLGVAGRQQDGGTLRMHLVRDRVRSQMQDVVVSKISRLHGLL
jgi:hypothetical protein